MKVGYTYVTVSANYYKLCVPLGRATCKLRREVGAQCSCGAKERPWPAAIIFLESATFRCCPEACAKCKPQQEKSTLCWCGAIL